MLKEMAAKKDAQAADKLKEAKTMRTNAALQAKGVNFMRSNCMAGWEVAQAKVDAMMSAALSMETAAESDVADAKTLRMQAEVADENLHGALQTVNEDSNGEESSEVASCSKCGDGSILPPMIMSQRLLAASKEATLCSSKLAEQASVLQVCLFTTPYQCAIVNACCKPAYYSNPTTQQIQA